MKSAIIASALLATVASAAPTQLAKRDNIDGVILNYALTLEHLENAFYKAGIAKFSAKDFAKAGFSDPTFYRDLKQVAYDEQAHVTFLQAGLKAAGVKAVEPCAYDFGFTTAKAFVDLASVLEGVGVSAYLGAAASITNKDYLTAAGSILTIEARHNGWVRGSKGQYPFPQAFETPLDFDQVYTLASAFIKTCPADNPALPVKAFPALVEVKPTTHHNGDKVTFKLPSGASSYDSDPLYCAWPAVTGPVFVEASVDTEGKTVCCKVPAGGPTGPSGQAYAILTTSGTALTDDNTVAGPAVVNVYV